MVSRVLKVLEVKGWKLKLAFTLDLEYQAMGSLSREVGNFWRPWLLWCD